MSCLTRTKPAETRVQLRTAWAYHSAIFRFSIQRQTIKQIWFAGENCRCQQSRLFWPSSDVHLRAQSFLREAKYMSGLGSRRHHQLPPARQVIQACCRPGKLPGSASCSACFVFHRVYARRCTRCWNRGKLEGWCTQSKRRRLMFPRACLQ